MDLGKKIAQVTVEGLQDIFDYAVTFPEGADTIILIAPNGFGKTALLSLLKDCVTLNLRRVASHTFKQLEIEFQDKTKWKFIRSFDGDRLRSEDLRRRRAQEEALWLSSRHAHFPEDARVVSFKRFDKSGKEVEEKLPDFDKINPRVLARALDRLPFLNTLSTSLVRDMRNGESMSVADAFRNNFLEIKSNPAIREMLAISSPSAVWEGIPEIRCVFIETQRLLYSKSAQEDGEKQTSQEEITRQAQSLSALLHKNYSDYAATSQALDRSFPNRLIARAREGVTTNTDELRNSLIDVEKKRAALTEAGILVEQADTIIATDDELLPKVVDALQIYVEDSQKKLSTYNEIYPKISVFRELMASKLKPKKLSIGREFGAAVSRDKSPLKLEGLSSGEKHEFIMLFKLIFETPSESLVLIDEPEISLHVVWQLEFMSDLRRIQSANPFQSIIATHSPQIFQGFKHLLVDLADQVK
ncbi:AAA family ATPase [Acidisoma cellulosilytica]|uniref:AAA family ATPase n=1 Tax=Acidisoma cellulosilyticum TaxID=2802395 RepID=A0A964E4F0_9PROT|nr:AAA family ATPase [Acidisoma cellulosilyticum]MCB8881625.1 AAA family ATPase [Acidisoma cellulosilyticum]